MMKPFFLFTFYLSLLLSYASPIPATGILAFCCCKREKKPSQSLPINHSPAPTNLSLNNNSYNKSESIANKSYLNSCLTYTTSYPPPPSSFGVKKLRITPRSSLVPPLPSTLFTLTPLTQPKQPNRLLHSATLNLSYANSQERELSLSNRNRLQQDFKTTLLSSLNRRARSAPTPLIERLHSPDNLFSRRDKRSSSLTGKKVEHQELL